MFLFLCLVLITKIKRQGKSKISLCNSIGGKLLLRPFASYNKLLGTVELRILSNIQDGAFLQKQASVIKS